MAVWLDILYFCACSSFWHKSRYPFALSIFLAYQDEYSIKDFSMLWPLMTDICLYGGLYVGSEKRKYVVSSWGRRRRRLILALAGHEFHSCNERAVVQGTPKMSLKRIQIVHCTRMWLEWNSAPRCFNKITNVRQKKKKIIFYLLTVLKRAPYNAAPS